MNKLVNSRRCFIKKALYKTPVLFVLGSFTRGVSLFADASGGPSGPPGGFLTNKPFKKKKKIKKLKF